MTVELIKMDSTNWEECAALEVTKEQKDFVPNNAYTIAQSKFISGMELFSITNDENHIVGLICYLLDDDGDMNLMRLMIDKNYQGKGYAKAAVTEIIKHIQKNYDNKEIWLSLHPENTRALGLYRSFGFVEKITGLESEEEIFLNLSLDK